MNVAAARMLPLLLLLLLLLLVVVVVLGWNVPAQGFLQQQQQKQQRFVCSKSCRVDRTAASSLLSVVARRSSSSSAHQLSDNYSNTTASVIISSSSSNNNNNSDNNEGTASIAVLAGPFDASSQLAGFWGQRPLLIRNAFLDAKDNDIAVGVLDGSSSNEAAAASAATADAWPTWDEIIQLACWNDNVEDDENDEWAVETGESARLIQHVPGKLESFDLELGPFEQEDLQDIISGRTSKKIKWTLVLNDVDRYKPALSQWMDQSFAFLPRWRRDDAQISLAAKGGGIGPHVDNYDVFLIQTSGQRKWLVDASKLSVADERTKLIPEIPVSILKLDDNDNNNNNNATTFTELLLQKGDMLYLPPRVVHWGTAVSDDCVTLSVGCRAPASADLVARVAEFVQMSVQPTAVQRYTDNISNGDFLRGSINDNNDDVDRNQIGPSLSMAVKESMKELVRNAVDDLLLDDEAWDELVGKITTDAVRYSPTMVRPYSEEDKGYRTTWGETPRDLLQRVMQLGERATLMRAPGISFATSQVTTTNASQKVDRLYANGCMWEVVVSNAENTAAMIFTRIERGQAVDGTMVAATGSGPILRVLEELIGDGFLQAFKQH